jgi:hypothetical protein
VDDGVPEVAAVFDVTAQIQERGGEIGAPDVEIDGLIAEAHGGCRRPV